MEHSHHRIQAHTTPAELKHELAHILWLGGSPCSGKSSITELLADRYGLHRYHVDDAFNRHHEERILPAAHPTLHKWTTLSWNELWMQPGEVLLEEAKAAYEEHFGMILDDLLALPRSAPVLVEGTALLPDCVFSLLQQRHQGIWIVPAEAFQRERYASRGDWVQSILRRCEQPERAFRNWMDRDVAFAQWVIKRTAALGLDWLQVDGTRTIAENASLVARHLRLPGNASFEHHT
jgi:2-phosphoglycerate kinase